MKRIITVILALLLLSGCGQAPTQEAYMNISQKEAKRLMDTQENYIILDVRSQEEYDEKHIPGAILIPHTQVEDLAFDMLPDLDQLILVYCRSGNRSKYAASILEEMGYTNIREFGGINTWPYEVE